ncbi:class I SAM-dependent methyltransferase [Aggregatilinea lenta]|uniref:class I SAM-dependent methyltransferase n=1 Tax=Aggregatilinea lenta TaxID=913108 RepID=UPI000E5B0D1E|nr:class I SAM-dependent methyltransferase [Aggregatilinea lenta]
MTPNNRGQITRSAADIYEEFFIPALFQAWAARVAEAAHLQPGQRVLDVACGTGVLAREAADRVGPGGSVVGLDVNEGMLAVAEAKAPQIEWWHGQAEALPFDDASFDAVVSQFGLMFFEDRVQAIREMLRVLKPGGTLAIAVWDTLDNTPGYATMVNLLAQLFGDRIADGLRSPYILGDLAALRSLLAEAGVPHAAIDTQMGTARFPSIASWVYTDIKGWVLSDALTDADITRLLAEAQGALAPFVTDGGSVAFAAPAHIITVEAG